MANTELIESEPRTLTDEHDTSTSSASRWLSLRDIANLFLGVVIGYFTLSW